MAHQEATQFAVQQPPSDGISSVSWLHHSNHLVATSWDKTVSLYAINNSDSSQSQPSAPTASQTTLQHRYTHSAGVLDAAISPDDLSILSVGCDNRLVRLDIQSQKTQIIGAHSQPIRCVTHSLSPNCAITGSWDKTLKVWDLSAAQPNVSSISVPDKVFAMSSALSSHQIIVGVAGRTILIYDLRKLSSPTQTRESSLKHQTRAIEGHPNGEQFVVSSIEGRVAVEFIDADPKVQSKKYAFKCHRVTDKTTATQTIFPVNTVAFHPKYRTFATGGGDGVVNIWDGDHKKRICQFPPYNTSIADVDFNADGSLVAIASSYTWEQGDKERPADQIWIRRVKESECKPKVKVPKQK